MLGKVGTGLLATGLIAAGILSSQGFVHIRVLEKQENGTHLRLVLPAMAVPIALEMVPREHLEEAVRQARPWLPAADAAAAVLSDCPDGPLVEVTEPGERVSIVKSGGSLVVDVNDPDERVHVSVPLAALRSTARVLASRAGPN